mgnify:CR=1 FL=1
MPKSQWEKIYQLRPVRFNWDKDSDVWIPDKDDVEDHGLIAEEVNEIYPELINYNGEGNPESVKYNSLSVMLLDEVKILRKEVKALKEKI